MLERLLEQRPRVREGRPDDAARRAADRVVAPVERRLGAGVEVRDHDGDRERRDQQPGAGDRRARRRARRRTAYQIPSPATTSPTSSFVVIASRAKTPNGDQAVLVQVPEGEEQERAGERDRVELVQRQPLGRRVQQVDEGERRARLARCRGACARARTRAARRARPRPPGRRAASRGSARSTRAARTRRGSGRSARPAARSGRRRRSSSAGSGRARCSRPSAPCCRGRSGRSCRRGGGGPRARRSRRRMPPSQSRRSAFGFKGAIGSAHASARRARPRSRARGRRRARRSRDAGASSSSRRAAAARPRAPAGSPGGTSSALSPSRRSSRAAGVSAVTSGVPQASAWNALFGITRAALADVPKMPSAHDAR